MTTFLRHLADALFPIRSLTGREGEWVTREELCALRLSSIRLGRAQLRKRGMQSIDRLIAAGMYNQPLLRRAIWTLKYKRLHGIGIPLGNLLCEAALPHLTEEAVLCPVPLHWLRRFTRGFNQASSLADAFSVCSDFPVCHLLRRVRSTGHQAWRQGRKDRKTALRKAFRCCRSVPSSVILIDDVATSGATLEACARALRRNGAKTIVAVVLALG